MSIYREAPEKEKQPFIWQQALFKLLKTVVYASLISLISITCFYAIASGYGCGYGWITEKPEPELCSDKAEIIKPSFSKCFPGAKGELVGEYFICTCPSIKSE